MSPITYEPMTFGGLKLVICQDTIVPKMQLSDDCPVTPGFRAEMNTWMQEFFGVTVLNVVPDGEVFSVPMRGEVHMNPRTYRAFRELYGAHVP